MSNQVLEDVAIVLNEELDQVAVAKKDIPAGTTLEYGLRSILLKSAVSKGQRFALQDIAPGEFIRQYGYPFGQSRSIRAGETITGSNVANQLPEVSLESFVEPAPVSYTLVDLERSFEGYKRFDGRVGTRNYYLIVPTSMCASATASQVAQEIERRYNPSERYPHIDGIVALPHTEGCGCAANEQIDRVLQVLKGFITHPNTGGCLIMDLGCEQTNAEKLRHYLNIPAEAHDRPLDWITIQATGGTRKAIEKSCSLAAQRLATVDQARRVPCAVEHLVVGTECGASDSFSGITANPIIGSAVDRIISGKGAAILSEVPEMVGAFPMLLPRFRSKRVASAFLEMIEWYEALARRLSLTLEDNLVPKNKEGGLINNFIKSLGAVLKGGSTVIEDIIDYGAPLRKKGLSIMQGPGGDLESVTGLSASGANLICFSTGKGTNTGSALCPVIKIASTDALAKALPEDIDFNAGRLLTESTSMKDLGDELFELILRVASGEKTWSEKWNQRQFQIWTAGKLPL